MAFHTTRRPEGRTPGDGRPSPRRALLLHALAAILLSAAAGARADEPPEQSTADGKYSDLLKTFAVPEDETSYGKFYDWGFWNGTEWKGKKDLPAGYWVYVAPNWHIWKRTKAPASGAFAWSPDQATGPPNTPAAGDYQTAWATSAQDADGEWLKADFEKAARVAEVRIRETFNPGAVSKVTALLDDGTEKILWEGKDPTRKAPEDFVVKPDVEAEAKSVKIYLDSKAVEGWNEIDAVELVAADGSRQWAKTASASSYFGQGSLPAAGAAGRSWGPEQATGAPDTAEAGDRTTAWATKKTDDDGEWLMVEYATAVAIAEVRIRETYNPGAVRKVAAIKADGTEEVLWEGKDPTTDAPAEFVVKPEKEVEAKAVKIYLASESVPGWNEIDAVELVGKDGSRQWAEKASASSSYADP